MFLNEIKAVVAGEFISLIDCVDEHINTKDYKKVGILGTPNTLKYGLYSDLNTELVALNVNEQKKTEKLIRSVIANNYDGLEAELGRQIKILQSKRCEAVILACTELSLIADKFNNRVGIIDPLSLVVPRLFQDIMEEI